MQILEDKSNLAFLQISVDVPCLETYVATNVNEIVQWADRRWFHDFGHSESACAMSTKDWWAVKASRGNGGRDVYLINNANAKCILAQVPSVGEFVLQR